MNGEIQRVRPVPTIVKTDKGRLRTSTGRWSITSQNILRRCMILERSPELPMAMHFLIMRQQHDIISEAWQIFWKIEKYLPLLNSLAVKFTAFKSLIEIMSITNS